MPAGSLNIIFGNNRTARLTVWVMARQDKQGIGTLINYRFPPPSEFTAGSTNNRLNIGNHAHVALEDDKGEITVELDDVFRLVFTPSSDMPEWSELGVTLRDKGWLECRSVHLKYRAIARKPAQIHAAIRVFSETGFQDVFASQPNYVGTTLGYHGADFSLSPRLLEKAPRCDLQLFFDNQDNTLDLHDLVMTGFR